MMEIIYRGVPGEPFKTAILKALLADYIVWCDEDRLRIRPRAELIGEPHCISWVEAQRLTGIVVTWPTTNQPRWDTAA